MPLENVIAECIPSSHSVSLYGSSLCLPRTEITSDWRILWNKQTHFTQVFLNKRQCQNPVIRTIHKLFFFFNDMKIISPVRGWVNLTVFLTKKKKTKKCFGICRRKIHPQKYPFIPKGEGWGGQARRNKRWALLRENKKPLDFERERRGGGEPEGIRVRAVRMRSLPPLLCRQVRSAQTHTIKLVLFERSPMTASSGSWHVPRLQGRQGFTVQRPRLP